MQTLHVVGESISIHYGPYLEQYLQDALVYSRKEGMHGDPAEAYGSDSSLVRRYLSACQAQQRQTDCVAGFIAELLDVLETPDARQTFVPNAGCK